MLDNWEFKMKFIRYLKKRYKMTICQYYSSKSYKGIINNFDIEIYFKKPVIIIYVSRNQEIKERRSHDIVNFLIEKMGYVR
jgi:hypothetical protein